jgi:hypothetical protein
MLIEGGDAANADGIPGDATAKVSSAVAIDNAARVMSPVLKLIVVADMISSVSRSRYIRAFPP